jgi:hypothetical protein
MPNSLPTQGWIPRSGLLYGVDYVVYALHPAAAHSHFSVLLLPLTDLAATVPEKEAQQGSGLRNEWPDAEAVPSLMEGASASGRSCLTAAGVATSAVKGTGPAASAASDPIPPIPSEMLRNNPALRRQQQCESPCGVEERAWLAPGHYPLRDWHDLQITARVTGTVGGCASAGCCCA